MLQKFLPIKIKMNYQSVSDLKETFRPIIDEFIKVLENHFSEDCTSNFYKNIESLKLTRKNHIPSNIVGIYDSDKNEIIYEKEELEKERPFALFHELFHMSSSVGENVGFHNGYAKCGQGVNEGYTELLTRKYFGWDKEDISYSIEMAVASILNDVIGEEKMKYYYMNANYYALSLELGKYLDGDVHSFMETIDHYTKFITSHYSFFFNISFTDIYINSLIDKISQYLAKIYIGKNMDIIEKSFDNTFVLNQLYSNYEHLLAEYQYYDLSYYKYWIDTSYFFRYLQENSISKKEEKHR